MTPPFARLLHLSTVKFEKLDRSPANYDTVMKRPKGQLPVASTVTLKGQVQFGRERNQDRLEPTNQGEYLETDGYCLFYHNQGVAAGLEVGDRLVEIDGRSYTMWVTGIGDETVYYNGPEWLRVDFQRKYDPREREMRWA